MPDVQYVGMVKGITEKKGGWHMIEIAVPGKEYPVKADTKLEHIINDARKVRDSDAIATFTVEETESENINPRNNKPYIERRLQKVEEGDHKINASSSEGPQPHHEAVHYADKDRLISRQVCLKVGATLYAEKALTEFEDGSSDDVPLAVMKAAARFERWLYRDIDAVPFS